MAQAQQVAPRREYETVYVLRPDISKEGAEKVSKRVTEVMQREGGTLTKVESWGRRALAFPVANYRRAYYLYLKYVGSGSVVSELERNFRMLEGVLKYQTVKLRDEVDGSQVSVDAEAVEFEAIEPPVDEEPEQTLAEQLGLQEPPPREVRAEEAAPAEAAPAEAAEGVGAKEAGGDEAAEASKEAAEPSSDGSTDEAKEGEEDSQ
jgi:small subunit ribosomal protein S6